MNELGGYLSHIAFCLTRFKPMAKPATLDRRTQQRTTRWLEALRAGFEKTPRCTAHRRDGQPCRLPRMRGSDRCPRHCIGKERDRIDIAALPRLLRMAAYNNAVGDSARNRLANIERRRLRRDWQKDPTIEGATIALSANDERRVRQYLLRTHDIDLSGCCVLTGRVLTPAARDRLLWCGTHALSGHISLEAAQTRVRCILADEERHFERLTKNAKVRLDTADRV